MTDKELKEKFLAFAKEIKDEEPKEEDTDEKEVKEMTKSLTDSIRETIQSELAAATQKASEESKAKAAKVSEGIEVKDAKDVEIKNELPATVYTTNNGKRIEMKKAEALKLKEWFKAVKRKDYKEAEKAFNEVEIMTKGGLEPMNETVAGDGGNLVPTILADFIVAIREDEEVMRPNSYIMDVSGMKSNTFDIPKELAAPKVYWEGVEQYDSDKSTTSMNWDKQTLTPYTVAAIGAITNQLVEDSPFSMPRIIAERLGRAMAVESDKIAITGTGASQPTGLDSYTPHLTVQGGGNLSFTHMSQVFWGMPQGYRKNAVWVMNSNRISLVQNLRDSQNMPIFQPQLLTGKPPMLMGRPVLENNNVRNDYIYLVNLKDYYWYAVKHGVRIDTADQAYVSDQSMFERNMVAIRAEERYDAELLDTRALCLIQNP